MTKEYFNGLYQEEMSKRLELDGLHFRILYDSSREELEKASEKEIYECLTIGKGDKTPRPDGFNMGFVQEFCLVIKTDIIDVFHEFYEVEKFVRTLNSSFLPLIAKISGVNNIRNFRPISLVSCVYKLIAKVLDRRMTTVLGKVIGERQHVFLGGRQILDAALIVNKVVDELIFRKREGVLCKLDVKKAYDHR